MSPRLQSAWGWSKRVLPWLLAALVLARPWAVRAVH